MSKPLKSTVQKSNLKSSADVLETIDRNLIGSDGELRELVEQATINSRVASIIYDARKSAGFTQKQLAERVGTRQSVINQLEDSDYEGHSLTMLNRIVKALGGHVDIRFIPSGSVTNTPSAVV